MTLELLPLFTARLTLAPPILVPNTPVGARVIAEVKAMEVEGERIRAGLKGSAGADWLFVDSGGTLGTADVRLTLETDDGALVFVHYNGRLLLSESPPVAYVAPLFDTGDERYAWLTRIQAVAKGTMSPDMSLLTYEVYEVR